MAYGGNPEKDALYLNVTPGNNDWNAVYRVAINGEVPVDGFWSIIVYNDKGYLERNPYNAYSLNSITAKKGADGSIAIRLGGCDGKIANCLPTMPGWNYMVRLYRPRRNPEQHMEIPRGGAGELTSSSANLRSACGP
jgi:hypothetical protein